jgi:F-type H+-transporting ATPase subunit b
MQRTIRSAALLLVIALAAPAQAAEDTLEIFPDIVPVLLDPLRWPQTHFFQLIVLFVLLIFPVNQLVLKPLLGVLDDRSARIEGARKRAGEVGAEAETVLGRYRAAVEQARKQAEELRKSTLESARGDQVRILAEARSVAEREVTTARSGVAGAIAGARATLRGQSEALAREAAASVLGRPLS